MGTFIKIIAGILLAIIGAFVLIVKPVSHEKADYSAFLAQAASRINSTDFNDYLKNASELRTGWSKQNITPGFKINMVGYGIRGDFDSVHDSLFVRTMLLTTSIKTVAIVSYDLMIVTPTIIDAVQVKIAKSGLKLDGIYFTATHTHSSFGGWSDNLLGKIILGGYNEQIVEDIATATIKSIEVASKDLRKTNTGFQKVNVPHLVYNRLSSKFPYDSWIRVIKFERDNGTTALLTIFQAHPTSLSAKLTVLSADYPGVLISQLEHDGTTNFAMFCAGAVASHGELISRFPSDYKYFSSSNLFFKRYRKTSFQTFDDLNRYADSLTKYTKLCASETKTSATVKLNFVDIPVDLGTSKMRISKYLQLREWAFTALLGKRNANITGLRIGDVVFIGAPGDLSGEFYTSLDSVCIQRQLFPVLTSFNGNYIGYLTPDKYYQIDKAEEMEMNWYGEGNSSYFLAVIEQLLEKM